MRHGYTWDDVRETPVAEVREGDTFIRPGLGTAWWTTEDGRVAGAAFAGGLSMDLDGTAFTVLRIAGDRVTARRHDGTVTSGVRPATGTVLCVYTDHT